MTEETKPSESVNLHNPNEDEIDILALAKVLWKGKKLIIWIVVILTFATAALSLFMTNIYTVRTVLVATSQNQGSSKMSALASQFGGIASLAGIAMPSASSSNELVSLLNSNVLKKNIIEKYNLLPVLFYDQWDNEKKAWKEPGIIKTFIAKLRPAKPGADKKALGVPQTWDGIRMLNEIAAINYDLKEDLITISVDFYNPEMAAAINRYFIDTLNEHMSSEAKRIAVINKKYLEQQLLETSDNLVQQKIYNLIAEKIETMMMAEVKEGFAFKVLEPPMTPDQKRKPKRALMVVVAFILSLFLGVFIVFFREYIKKIKEKSAGGQNAK